MKLAVKLLIGEAHRTDAATPALRAGRTARLSIVEVSMPMK